MLLEIDDDKMLKLLEQDDSEKLFALTDDSRGYLRKWLPWVDGTLSVEYTKSFIQFCQNQHASNNGFNAGIWFKGEIVGCIGYHSIDWANNKTSIGYWLGEKFQGNGIITKSCKRLVDYSFNELGLNRVEIRCGLNNLKSRAIPEKLGFTNEGRIREAEWLYDHYIDHIVYGMLRSDWNSL
ncbi:GNAT family N-acetyltransferase [Paenibacillus sp. Root444D2]|uniref:GNAT family N-acetyltransferase n=1 Tax=Paenibacillus sp. Root444D2 TaxID=1736538 RepID=UPI0007098BC3|nr:GNAT family protein [Paenibacillus sp. Root444D2]KQX46857.1 alanine acetyltransferase [Paenibacillus sp. Root444D2]